MRLTTDAGRIGNGTNSSTSQKKEDNKKKLLAH